MLILITMALASALPTVNVTVANAVLPQMQGDLSAGLEEISWVLTATLVATAVGIPVSGWFSQRFGRRRAILLSVATFTFASSMFAFATTLEEVIFWRTCQGLFGGPLPSLCIPVLLDSFPKRDHAQALAVWSGGTMLAPILGPAIGGYLTALYDWRLAFVFLVPFGILTYFFVIAVIDESRKQSDLRLDWIGFIAIGFAIASAQIIMDRGNRQDWFESPEILTWAIVGCFAFYVFTVHSLTTRQPFIDLRILLDRNYVIGTVCMMISGVLTFAPLLLLPNMLGHLRGVPVEIVSLMLIPRGVGYVVGVFGFRRLIRIMDARAMLALGFAIQMVGFWYLIRFDLSVGAEEIFTAGLILGVGEGIMWTPVATITFSTLAPRLRNYGSAIFQFGRFFASGVGISVVIVVLTRSIQVSRSGFTEFITPYSEVLPFLGSNSLWDIATVQGLARLEAELVRQSTMIGYLNDFWLLLLLTLAVFSLICLAKNPQTAE